MPQGRCQGAAVYQHGGERVQVQLLAGGGSSVPLPPGAGGQELQLRLLRLHRQAQRHPDGAIHAQNEPPAKIVSGLWQRQAQRAS